tara:strand:+ start:3129 stop:4916 length:1788 start_codon:yes stop_codon:yes gene_type:complete
MADELKQEVLEEGYTEFAGPSTQGTSPYFYPTGVFGRFFAKFFATKAAPAVAREVTNQSQYDGDTVVNPDVVKTSDPAGGMSLMTMKPSLPKVEYARKSRYKDYEIMDEYPEIGAAFDIYADDCTQIGFKNENWTVKTDNALVIEEVNNLFETIDLERFIWDISRNTVKYGDCFIELVLDLNNPQAGVQRVKILDPKYLIRVENEYGYLTDFLQEIPKKGAVDNMWGNQSNNSQYMKLDVNQIVHFRLHSSDPTFYPYGKSIAALCHRTFRSLKLMEDAMLIYRLSRAPERRIFYVDVGNLPTGKSEMYIERIKEKFKKEKFYDSQSDTVDARYNPMSSDEDFFVPIRGNTGTKIETLPGAQNLGEVEDVKYFRDKLLAALKVPKDYLVEKDKSPERKANLSQLDVKFARTVLRIQRSIELGMENMAKRHLQLRGFPNTLVEGLKIKLPEPSDMFAKRKLDLDLQKTQVLSQMVALQLIPKRLIYKEYFNYTESEITEIEELLKKEMEDAQTQMQPGGAPMGPPGQEEEQGAEQQQEEAEQPQQENTVNNLENLKAKLLSENNDISDWKYKAVSRVLKRIKNTEEPELGSDVKAI